MTEKFVVNRQELAFKNENDIYDLFIFKAKVLLEGLAIHDHSLTSAGSTMLTTHIS